METEWTEAAASQEHQGLPAKAREWRGSSLTLSEGIMLAADILTLGL